MSLELRDIDTNTDFPALAQCLYESYEEPAQPFFHVWFPIFGSDKAARQASLEEAATRLAGWHANDPTSRWKKVVDTATGNIAGASLWNIYDENPFLEPHDIKVTWFPDDGSRKFAEQLLDIHNKPRAQYGQRPHLYLFIIFTHPDYRRKGVGQQLMTWGMNQADKMGVEIFLDATPIGRPLYDANNFVAVQSNAIVPQCDEPDEAWKEVEARVGGPVPFSLMWRPVGGKYEDGATVFPWSVQK